MALLHQRGVCVILAVVLHLARLSSAQTTYYVNGDCGDDSWSGLRRECSAPDGPKATIQAALDAAGHSDTVVVADGTYEGVGNTNLEFEGKAITLRSDEGADRCEIVDTGSGYRGGINFDSGEGPDAVVEGITFRNFRGEMGGGVRIRLMSTPTIRDCVFVGCNAALGSGAGIGLDGSCGATIQRCRFTGNEARLGAGAGIAAVGMGAWVVLEDCVFSSNQAPSGFGGAIYLDDGADINAIRCTFSRNRIVEDILAVEPEHGLQGGAVYVGENCTGQFADCSFSSNTVIAYQAGRPAFGGGAYVAEGSLCMFLRCRFDGNSAGGGGGGEDWVSRGSAIRAYRASVDVIDCLITRNETGSSAVASSEGSARIINSTIVANVGYKESAVSNRWMPMTWSW